MTTGTPRPPLFTTTIRPGIHGLVTEQSARINSRQDNPVSTTLRPVKVYRPAQLLPAHNNVAYASQNNDDPTPSQSTATPIPAAVNREPLVAVRQPDGRNAVLIPLSHLQAGYVPILGMYPQHERQYEGSPNRQPAVVEVEQQQAVVRRLQVPVAPPLPVRVDQDGHIREATSRQPPPQYITPVAPTFITTSRYESMPVDEDVDNIRPPVSTRDLQRLLEQLIQRQSRLERIVTLTRRAPPPQPHQWEQHRFKQYRMLYPAPQFSNIHKDPVTDAYQQPEYVPELDSVRPVRRFARQKQIYPKDKENLNQQYLPSDVREMLLLKMLQLAINPALPLTEEDVQEIEEKRKGVGGARNVEILGEEDPEDDRVKIGQRFTN
ncbi:unnamed protein product [Acanthoscelides obtectus]|uniref:Uncharacterized protein n=1 Tax=Acanthoscelides obtectus TaxID=200917 RepID=A0A9P0PTA5_ACAOB|nr:unnamed protein product [Acanthoscelides obtectus]CAK1644827.1 hypothetical protein AOBTE_LOCUS13951 [Acanthoscelides obtectus]